MNIAEISDSTICKHCGERFSGPRIEVIGQPEARLQAYLQVLSKHFYEKHPQQAQMMDIHTAIYSGLLFLMNFKTTDKELNGKRDQLRWTIHQQTLNARFSDASLTAQCRELSRKLVDTVSALDHNAEGMVAHEDLVRAAFEVILIEVFTGMRNDLEEPGKYAVEQPAKVVVC
jgi:hypothetical protein